MTTAVAEREPKAEDGLAVFRKQDAIVADLKKHLSLKVAGVNDKKGLAAVHEARIEARDARIAVEKTRKKLNEDAQDHIKKVNSEAKRITAEIVPVETYLQEQEDAIEAEKARIKQAADDARKAKIKQRFDALQACGYQGDMMAVPELTDEAFAKLLADAQATKAEADRLAEEARQQQAAEAERLRKLEADAAAERARQEAEAAEQRRKEEAALAAERERLAEITRKQEAEAARLRAEQERIEADKQAAARAAELERARVEAAEKARIETEARLKREAEEAKAAANREAVRIAEKAKADEAARLKAEAERPQREKILAVASLLDAIEVPDGPGAKAVAKAIERCMNEIQAIANGPLA